VALDFLKGEKPSVLSVLVIRIPDLLKEAAKATSVSFAVRIFDSTNPDDLPIFLGGAHFVEDRGDARIETQMEQNLTDVQDQVGGRRYEQRDIQVADKTWTIALTSHAGSFQSSPTFVIFGGLIIFLASGILAVWFYTYIGRLNELEGIRSQAEKAELLSEASVRQTASERQLNEYLAHEVRNPLTSAITALSFVSAAAKQPINEESRKGIQDDVSVVDASLQFINELLRNLLDINRASDKLLKITMAPTDLRRDVIEPVAAILHQRGTKVKVLVDCPNDLIVETDRMRLKQCTLNLATNSSKFVVQGYIKLKAMVVEGKVRICIEDSGPGIPPEKRSSLFRKYQDSLDLLAQGTGLGLCLCKQISHQLGGELFLDEDFQSGIEGCKGTRFVLDLCCTPLLTEQSDKSQPTSRTTSPSEECESAGCFETDGEIGVGIMNNGSDQATSELPESLSVLLNSDRP